MQFKVQHQKLVKMQRATWAVDKPTAGAPSWRKAPSAAKVHRLLQNLPSALKMDTKEAPQMAKACALFGECLERDLDPLGGIRSLMARRLKMRIVPVICPVTVIPTTPGWAASPCQKWAAVVHKLLEGKIL